MPITSLRRHAAILALIDARRAHQRLHAHASRHRTANARLPLSRDAGGSAARAATAIERGHIADARAHEAKSWRADTLEDTHMTRWRRMNTGLYFGRYGSL